MTHLHTDFEADHAAATTKTVEVKFCALAQTLRSALVRPLTPARIASALAETCARWRRRDFVPRRETIAAIAAAWGWSEPLLSQSLDALLAPFSLDALENFARRAPRRRDLVGLIMPGNIPGAGLHEIAIGLIAECALMVKTATAEPIFFARFAETLREIDREVGARLAIINWSRERADLTAAMSSNCDWVAAFGDDETIAQLSSAIDSCASAETGAAKLAAAFGSRVSGVLVSVEMMVGAAATATANAIARDVSLFEQQGCLSPHHVFVESPDGAAAREFARHLAEALELLATTMPPPRRHGLEDAASLRRIRETARWRAIGGDSVTMWEGAHLGWTVIYDEAAVFAPAPGFRTTTVSPVGDLSDLRRRLEPVVGRLEAFAIAAPLKRREGLQAALSALGVCYLCDVGAMQSPPLDWSHGGGAFLRALSGTR
jgi:hypothetical protein